MSTLRYSKAHVSINKPPESNQGIMVCAWYEIYGKKSCATDGDRHAYV